MQDVHRRHVKERRAALRQVEMGLFWDISDSAIADKAICVSNSFMAEQIGPQVACCEKGGGERSVQLKARRKDFTASGMVEFRF